MKKKTSRRKQLYRKVQDAKEALTRLSVQQTALIRERMLKYLDARNESDQVQYI